MTPAPPRFQTATRRLRKASSVRRLGAAVVLALGAAACGAEPRRFPAPVSPAPTPSGSDGLRAGFGRADITPPPGVGLFGYGPEGKRSAGYRTRLHARALLLEDATGERVALVGVDLPTASMLLHRSVAEAVLDSTRVGADRLILTATHTHAGPGHVSGFEGYNEFGSSVAGFDEDMLAFLVDRIAEAVFRAGATLRAARAAWGTSAVWTVTRNRSLAPFRKNQAAAQDSFPAPLFPPDASGHVDSTLAMLRIDLEDPSSGTFRPAGAFSVFAVHGIGNAAANDLLDSDIHGLVSRGLERHIDRMNGLHEPTFQPRAVHILAQGAGGDVVPEIAEVTQCQVPHLTRVRRVGGPRSPPGPELWIPPEASGIAECLAHGRSELNDVADLLTDHAVVLFDDLGGALSAAFPVRRVFSTVSLPDTPQLAGLCDPRVGTGSIGGANGRRTRFASWRLFGVVDAGFSPDGGSARDPKGCQAEKRVFLGGYQEPLLLHAPLPRVAQFGAVRLGGAVLGLIPFEATTVAGGRIRQAMAHAARTRAVSSPLVLQVGLANGYNQYLATREEYALQHYEGASTLYGPDTASRVASILGALTYALPFDGSPSPTVGVPEIVGDPGRDRDVLPGRDAGPPPAALSRTVSARWDDGALLVSWNDLHPGRLVPADGPVLRIDERGPTGWVPATWDDDRFLEVRALRPASDGYRWQARWAPDARPAGDVRVVLLARPGVPEVLSSPVHPH